MLKPAFEVLDDATAGVTAAVEVLRSVTSPDPADLSAVFGSLGDHLRRLDHLAATLPASYDRLPVGLRCDNDADPFLTVRDLLVGLDDIRMHLDRADRAVQTAHNHAARIALT
jgi:hypothetical protein